MHSKETLYSPTGQAVVRRDFCILLFEYINVIMVVMKRPLPKKKKERKNNIFIAAGFSLI